MKKKKYLPLYKKWIISGRIPEYGLCESADDNNELCNTFYPGKKLIESYWGSIDIWKNKKYSNLIDVDRIRFEFTPLRQTIILFMAAINDEI